MSITENFMMRYEDDDDGVDDDVDDNNDDDDDADDNNDKVVSLAPSSSIRLATKCHITSHRAV